MGFEDRQYSQEEWNVTPTDNPVSKWFVILSVVLFILQAVTVSASNPNSPLFELASLKATEVLHGQVWRLLTFVICHHPSDILGIVFSLLIIWKFGTELERMYGSKEMLFYLLGTTLFVGVSFTAWGFVVSGLRINGSYTIALGFLALFATHFPKMEVYILPLISIQLRWLVALYTLFGLYPALFAVQSGAGIFALPYACSVLSVPFALAYRRFDWHLAAIGDAVNPLSLQRAWRARAARSRLKVYAPAEETTNLDAKVDAILAKIHEQGSESLTAAERATLEKASERERNKRSF